MKKYPIEVTPELIKRLKPYWQKLKVIENKHHQEIRRLEGRMEQDIKIEYIEFFYNDGGYVGIGNVLRTIRLIHAEELE